jgi:predicted neutral ceramidase superfamily lipid hydrolase
LIKGVKVIVYNPAKTVADCFNYRNKSGLDVCHAGSPRLLAQEERDIRRTPALRKGVPRRSYHATISGVHSSVTKSETKNIAASVRQRLANLAQDLERRFSAVALPLRREPVSARRAEKWMVQI